MKDKNVFWTHSSHNWSLARQGCQFKTTYSSKDRTRAMYREQIQLIDLKSLVLRFIKPKTNNIINMMVKGIKNAKIFNKRNSL